MDTIGERIRLLRKSETLTLEKFGERIGITASSCSTMESGKSNPSDQTIRSICREFRVREEWLRAGEEPIYMLLTPNQERAAFLASVTAGESSPEINAFIDALKSISDSDLKIVMAFVSRTYEAYKENLKNSESPEAD